ncbi:hypothetical protein WJX72_004398 [[Myrmecia] bisecta]|uniref:Chlorophyll b reductase n=1 Tax=[Myrmecia] bisecta TaxID=41462 RepID=A0AAW1R6P0_9CHLO
MHFGPGGLPGYLQRLQRCYTRALLNAVDSVGFSPNKALPFYSSNTALDGLHKPVGLVLSSAYVLAAACHLSGVADSLAWLPILTGGSLGALYAALNRAGMRRFWRAPSAGLNVVITGSGRGIGKALAREFLMAGDRVMVTSRTAAGVQRVMAELREEVSPDVWVSGIACEVSDPDSVVRLASAARLQMGSVDVWINNAGYSGSFQAFLDATPEQITRVVQTNLLGSLLCTREAIRLMSEQELGGHVFNMDGAGADGLATPQYAAYGATKAGIAHLMGSLKHEARLLDTPVGIHTLSPGMVLTGLLLEGASEINKKIFNILCEQPETVAAFLVPRVRTVVARKQASAYIRFLTLGRALQKFAAAPLRTQRFFDKEGKAVYLPERERILGKQVQRTERLAARAARRSRELAMAYSLSLAIAYLIIVVDSVTSTIT